MCITYIISLILIKTPQSYILLLYPFKWWGNWVRKQFFALKHRASMRLCQNFNTGSWLRSQNSFICLYIPSSFPSIQHVQQIFSESLLCFRLFFFWPHSMACGILTLTRDWTVPLAVEAKNLNQPGLSTELPGKSHVVLDLIQGIQQ